MGYRLLPTRAAYPTSIESDAPFTLDLRWLNRGVGRALRNYELRLALVSTDGKVAATAPGGPIRTSTWIAGSDYNVATSATFKNVKSGSYELAIGVHDAQTNRDIELPIVGGLEGGFYEIGNIAVTADKRAANAVR